MMKILLLSRYGHLGASSRYRSYQYLPFLENYQIKFTSLPLVDDDYLQSKYTGKSIFPLTIVIAYVKRLIALIQIAKYDLIWIEYELFPSLPAWFESIISLKKSYIVDYDDAIFHRYDLSHNPVIKQLLGKKIDKIMISASIVTVGNSYLAERAIKAGASRVELLPTVIDLNKYPILDRPNNDTFTIGWIGSPTTTKYLESLAPVFQSICSNGRARVVAIGAKDFQIEGVDLQIKKWSEETEVNDLNQIDVGIMPLDDTPWSRGKCGFKLIQYMACSKPVIASPVGINTEIVEEGVNGFLAATHQEWIDALSKLRDNWELQEKMGQNGRKKVAQEYCLAVTAPKLLELLKSVAKES